MAATITETSIRGYDSVARLERLPVRLLNVLVGANGAGKSNVLGLLPLVCKFGDREANVQVAVRVQSGADALPVSFGRATRPGGRTRFIPADGAAIIKTWTALH